MDVAGRFKRFIFQKNDDLESTDDFINDGSLLDATSLPETSTFTFDSLTSTIATTTNGPSNAGRTIMTTEKETNPHKGFIYDYYHDIDVIRALLHCTSGVLLLIAIILWFVIWCKSRYGHPYRCVSFIMILTYSLIYHLISLVTLFVYVPDGFSCQFILALKAYGNMGMYTFFFLFVLLCIGVAMRRLESGGKFYFLVAVAMLLPMVLIGATTALRVLRRPHAICDLLDDLTLYLWYDRAPKCFLLFGTICILSVLFYWLFCFDNSIVKLNRDFLLIRHSSVTMMVLVCYCFFLELYQIVFLTNTPDGQIRTAGVARNGLILDVLMCAKGAVAAFLICFFDIEIFNLMYTFPCCPDLSNAVVDQTWERRIRHESRVKFFEDSASDDNQPTMISGVIPYDKDNESDHVLPEPDKIQRYGSVKEEEEGEGEEKK